MPLFVSRHQNRVDSKGRVSVPAEFRAQLEQETFQGVVLFPSHVHPALEGFAWSRMEDLSARLDQFDSFSEAQEDLAAVIFGQAVQLSFDNTGRIQLPQELRSFAGIDDSAAFVGLGSKFQIWNPVKLAPRVQSAVQSIKDKGLTVPKVNS